MTVAQRVVVSVLDEGASAPVQLHVTEDLALAIAGAATVNEGHDKFALSFTSLFIGLYAVESPAGEWLREYCLDAKVDMALIAKRRDIKLTTLLGLRTPRSAMSAVSRTLSRTNSAKAALTEAERIARDASGPDQEASPVDVRHVIAAYATLPNYHDQDFRTFRINRPAMASAFAEWAAHEYPAEAEFWTRFAGRVFPEQDRPPEPPGDTPPLERLPRPLSGYSPDVYSETDLLDIEREVTGLAALITSHKTALPLSIGLFGPWGSGKTFFMRHLQRCIDNFCKSARESDKPQAEVAYFRHVVQIEFNAWHYSEGKLLASLVEHILQNLRATEDESPEAVEARRALILQKLEPKRAERSATEDRVKAAQEKVDEKQQEVNDLQRQQKSERDALAHNLTNLMALDAARAAVELDPVAENQARQALDRLGITAVGGAARDVQAALGRAREELSGLGGLIIPLLRGEGRTMRLAALLLVVLAPFIVGGVAYLLLARYGAFTAQIGDWLGRVAAFMTAGGAWLNKQMNWVAARRQELEQAKGLVDARIERELAALQAAHATQLAARLDELERLRAQHSAAVLDRDERARQVNELETELARTSSTFRLNEFILDRARANDYRRYLGFMALVRRDFDNLSRLIEGSNRLILKGEQVDAADDPQLNRIVLYIDDLDRCPEDRVVEVLRAVHLLLAFPLFVVIVAVDSRWLTRCLLERYPQMLGAVGLEGNGTQGHATPMDYLEKIFQIPLWLPSLTSKQRVDLVQALLEPPAAPPPPLPRNDEGDTHDEESRVDEEARDGDPVPSLSKTQEEDAGQDSKAERLDTTIGKAPDKPEARETRKTRETRDNGHDRPRFEVNLDPPGLVVTPHEWAFVKDVGSLLSATPRALKRYANTYRLIKASLPDEELRTFADEGPASAYQCCMYQLAVLMGVPGIASDYLEQMSRYEDDEETTVRTFVETFERGDAEDWRRVLRWLTHEDREAWQDVPMRDIAKWAPWVARYTFTPE